MSFLSISFFYKLPWTLSYQPTITSPWCYFHFFVSDLHPNQRISRVILRQNHPVMSVHDSTCSISYSGYRRNTVLDLVFRVPGTVSHGLRLYRLLLIQKFLPIHDDLTGGYTCIIHFHQTRRSLVVKLCKFDIGTERPRESQISCDVRGSHFLFSFPSSIPLDTSARHRLVLSNPLIRLRIAVTLSIE